MSYRGVAVPFPSMPVVAAVQAVAKAVAVQVVRVVTAAATAVQAAKVAVMAVRPAAAQVQGASNSVVPSQERWLIFQLPLSLIYYISPDSIS